MKTKKKGLHQKRSTFSPNSGEDQKKSSSPRTEQFFSNSSGDLHLDARRNQILGGDTDEDHNQIIGVDTAKLLGEIYPPSPPGLATPTGSIANGFQAIVCYNDMRRTGNKSGLYIYYSASWLSVMFLPRCY